MVTNHNPITHYIAPNDPRTHQYCYRHNASRDGIVQDVMTINCVPDLQPRKFLIIRIPGDNKFLQLCEVEIPLNEEGIMMLIYPLTNNHNKKMIKLTR